MGLTTSADVRSFLTHALRLDLIGPDPDEPQASEVLPIAPSRWYLTGFLVPWNAPAQQKRDDNDTQGELEYGDASAAADEDNDPPEPLPLVDGIERARPAGRDDADGHGALGGLQSHRQGRRAHQRMAAYGTIGERDRSDRERSRAAGGSGHPGKWWPPDRLVDPPRPRSRGHARVASGYTSGIGVSCKPPRSARRAR